ncbi:MAG: ERCC4 domain-containing protein [Planctomycetes bacterium]|nr:ERCC4 domain-containing protein [Planctomycetota bacterium]
MDFRIVIDTREQAEYSFACETVRRKLEAGDYSADGYEDVVAVERKSLADFARTTIHEFARFAAELDKLAHLPHACIVVEGDLDHVLRGQTGAALRGVSPESLLGAAVHIHVRFGVPVIWCGSRQAACAFTDAFLRMAVREAAARRVAEVRHA